MLKLNFEKADGLGTSLSSVSMKCEKICFNNFQLFFSNTKALIKIRDAKK